MAHATQDRMPHTAARLAACLAIASASSAFAIGLGEIEVASNLGENLVAFVALAPVEGERVDRACFSLGRGPPAAGPFITRATLALEGVSGDKRLRIRSTARVNELVVTLRVNAACPRGGGLVTRDYVVLLDPRAARVPSGVAPAAGGSTGALQSLPGDTLKAIATAIFPNNRTARRVYIEALREDNSAQAPLKDDEPIPVGTAIVLPDLRTFARGRRVTEAPRTATTATIAPALAPAPVLAPRPPKPAPVAAPKPPAPAPAKAASKAAGSAFVLKLSAPEIDLARTRGVTEQVRTQLRERQLVLDADDQVAALLSLRNSMKVLENRVVDLQLKLSTMTSVPAAAAKPLPEPVKAAPKIEVPVAKVQPPPPKIEAPVAKVEPPPAPKIEEPAPKAEPEPAKVEPSATKPATRPLPAEGSTLPLWLWGVIALLVVFAAWIGLRLLRGRGTEPAFEAEEPTSHKSTPLPDESVASTPMFEVDAPAPPPAPARRTMDSDASLQTSVSAGDPSDLRRRYIEERFPEIVAHTIVLEEPDSIVKGARLFYEDGAVSRAAELLQFAVEERPDELKRWLALFEIYRLERLAGEFAELALRFKDYHGTSDYWAKVQFFGREIDPSNALYQEESFNDIETIGMPSTARKMQALVFDPLAENWLNAPMDFSSEVLATELRRKLLGEAGISEADLIPNPMPALKNVEMFTVA